ncbi:MAG TPA: TolC family protein, partial [Holophagaceae bacterium]|nr:TolC family protein [Holophagaceae bacterium]
MRMLMRLLPALLIAGALHGQAPDPQLASLIQDALAANPQLKASRAAIDAERAKVPQAGALPDPMVSLGYQNDGFRKLTYGESGFAFAQLGVSQAFPYPGKRRLRGQIAEAGVAAADAASERVRLDLIADVKRAYFDL